MRNIIFSFKLEASIFVLLIYSENFGIVVAEALAVGVPVITTKGTPWEELHTYNCGWWIEIGTKKLKVCLEDVIQKSPQVLIEMGTNGRRLIDQKYRIESVGNQILEFYKKINLSI